jgi:uncharacterized membrane protein YhaH (DUF805 family)
MAPNVRRASDGRVMIGFLFNPNGRVSRSQIWIWYFFPQLIASGVARMLDSVIFASSTLGDPMAVAPLFGLSSAVTLFFLWPSIAVPVKRFHDRGMSGWWVLWFGLAVLGGVLAAIASLASTVDLQAAMEAAQKGVEVTPTVAADQATGAAAFASLGLLVALAAAIAQFVILFTLPGDDGANRFGPDPRNGPARARGAATEQTGSEWADRLADPARLAAVAASVGAKPAPGPELSRDPRATRSAASPGSRPSFGRRGT